MSLMQENPGARPGDSRILKLLDDVNRTCLLSHYNDILLQGRFPDSLID